MANVQLRKNPETGETFLWEDGAADWQRVDARRNHDTGETFVLPQGGTEWRSLGVYSPVTSSAASPAPGSPTDDLSAAMTAAASQPNAAPAARNYDLPATLPQAAIPAPAQPYGAGVSQNDLDEIMAAGTYGSPTVPPGSQPDVIGTLARLLASPPAPDAAPDQRVSVGSFPIPAAPATSGRGNWTDRQPLPPIQGPVEPMRLPEDPQWVDDLAAGLRARAQPVQGPQVPRQVLLPDPQWAPAAKTDPVHAIVSAMLPPAVAVGAPASIAQPAVTPDAAAPAPERQGRIPAAFQQGMAGAIKRTQDFAQDTAASLEGGVLGRTQDAVRGAIGLPLRGDMLAEDRAAAIRDAAPNPMARAAHADLKKLEEQGFQVKSLGDVKGLRSALEYTIENVTTSLPQMGVAMAGGALSAPVMISMLGAEANEELKTRTDMDEASRVALSLGAGSLMYALDTVGLGKVLGGLTPANVAVEAAAGRLGETLAKRGLARSAARVIEAAVAEGSTEALQEGVVLAAVASGGGTVTRDEVLSRLGESFAGGAAAGGAIRAGGEVVTAGGTGAPATQEAPAGLGAAPAPEARPAAPEPPAEPPAAAPEPPAAPGKDGPRYVVLPESEGTGGDWRETGRMLRYDMTTGKAEVIQNEESLPSSGSGGEDAGSGAPGIGAGAPPATDAAPAMPSPPSGTGGRSDELRIDILRNKDVASVGTDAKAFQYKEGGDADGVTERLRGVKEWDPLRAGMAIVYQRKDGSRVVADGHQRLGLAKRLAGEGQKIQLPAITLREEDGYTPEQVRSLAALKNIAEGTGTPIDAAKVLRAAPEAVESMNLPPNSALVRDMKGLSRLSDDAFGMVVNEVASVRDGAIVGQVVTNAAAQANILSLLNKLKPANAFQAEQIARQAAAETQTETQSSLFGDEQVEQNLYAERAKVLDGALSRLRKNAALFKTLVDNETRIAAVGNEMATDANRTEMDADRRIQEYLARQANTKGPISDALSQAARSIRSGTSVGNATTEFLRVLRGIGQGDGAAGSQAGATRPDAQPDSGSEPQAEAVEPAAERAPAAVQTLVQFAAERGLTTTADVDSHIHAGLRSAPDTKTYRSRYEKELARLQAARDETSRLYLEAIDSGAIREPTSDERLRATAENGHSDNAATQAAQRVLAKREARRKLDEQQAVPAVQTERTPEGEQSLIPGVKPITDRDRAEAAMAKPKVGRDEGPGSGRDDLFGNPEDRRDLFDAAPAPKAKDTTDDQAAKPGGDAGDVEGVPAGDAARGAGDRGSEGAGGVPEGSRTGDGTDRQDDVAAAAEVAEAIAAREQRPGSARVVRQTGATGMAPDLAPDVMRDLRAALDRMGLSRVSLGTDRSGRMRQGAMVHHGPGQIDILIGHALDPEKTLYHESIHAMRAMDMFTPAEWAALVQAAVKSWVTKHDIQARYPDLLPSEQIEEAIAEEFAEHATKGTEPRANVIGRAYRKAMRLLKAIRDVFAKRELTAKAVFDRAMWGELQGRDATNSGEMQRMEAEEADQALSAWGSQLMDWLLGRANDNADLVLGPVPKVLRAQGAKGEQMIMRASKLRKVIDKHKALTPQALMDLPSLIGDPLIVIHQEGETQEGERLVVTDLEMNDGDVVVAAIKLRGEDEARQPATVVLTTYPKSDVRGLVKRASDADRITYVRGERGSTGYRHTGANSLSASLSDTFNSIRVSPKIQTPARVFKGGKAPWSKDQAPGGPVRSTGLYLPKDGSPDSRGADTMPDAEGAGKEQRMPAQQRAHAATAMAHPAHIPDRAIFEELRRSGVSMWDRISGARGAAADAIDKARVQLQDRILPLLRAQQAVMRETGRPLPIEQDAHVAATTFSGKVGRHLFEIDEDFTKPIADLIGKTKGGLTVDGVGEWLTARHAKERNEYIASINPDMPDGGAGMTTAEAQRILADAAAGPHADALAQIGALIDGLRDRTIDLRRDAGLLTNDEHAIWRKQYRHYVPLKGFAETDHSEATLDVTGIGRRFNTRGPESKRALGRKSEAFNPLIASIVQAQEVAIRAEKNRVGQALYNLAKDNPAPAMWEVKTPQQKRYFNRTTGLVETRVEPSVSMIMDPGEMAVKVGGVEHRIVFNDPRIARAAGTVGADRMNAVVSLLSKFGRYFSTVNTMLNPEFMITNAFRDMQTAQINIQGFGREDKAAIAKSMIRNWPRAWAAVYRGQRTTDPKGEWGQWFKEYQKAGAQVSFWNMDQPEAQKLMLERMISDQHGSFMRRKLKYLRLSTESNPVLGGIERVNMAVDNAIRLAAFVEARKRGWPVERAAALSKNLTVNFNRRGEAGPTLNAAYVFFNAAVQGTQIMVDALTHKRVLMTVAGIMAMAFLNDLANASFSDEDDDGELAYDKIPDWKQQMNMVAVWAPVGDGNALTLPMPYGYNIFWYGGTQLGKVYRGVKDPGDALAGMFGAMVKAFSPISGESFQATLSPTILDPINEMMVNEDWLGRPIRPESPFNDFGPDAYKFYGGAPDWAKGLADFANRATGGDEAQPGWLDVSPEYLDYSFSFLTGGVGRFLSNSIDTTSKLMTGRADEIEAYRIPFYRKLITDMKESRSDVDRYYRFRTEVQEAADAAKTYVEVRKPVPSAVKANADLAAAARKTDKELKAIRDERKKLDEADMDAAAKRDRMETLADRERALVLAFNKQFIAANGRRGE